MNDPVQEKYEASIRLIMLRLLNELAQKSIGNEAVPDADGDEWLFEAFDGLQFAKNVTEALNDAEWKKNNGRRTMSDMRFDGQSLALFDALFRDKIEGLPGNIMSMKINLDISDNSLPFMELLRAVTNEDNIVQANPEGTGILTVTEYYRLFTVDGKVTAKKA